MDTNFWLERWLKHEIGFHQPRINEYLMEYWPRLGISVRSAVFVPLCGKTLDMRWLQARGHRVIGVEIARSACEEFFAEWGVAPEVRRHGKFERWSARDVTLLCGDFFDLQASDLIEVRGVFDRAALIALPPEMRAKYVRKLLEILPPHAIVLLVAPEYDPQQMKGPPFAVGAREIRQLFAGCAVEELASVDVTDSPDNARFRQRGLTQLMECVFRIEPEASNVGLASTNERAPG